MVVVGFDRPTITRAMELVEAYDFLYAALDGIQLMRLI